MRAWQFPSIAAAAVLASAVGAVAPDSMNDAGSVDCARPSEVVALFYRSVKRGELVVFGRTLARHQLRPVTVEYAYELVSRARTVKVRSMLVTAIPVPKDDRMVVRKVVAVMDSHGRIVESHAYIELL